MTAGSLTLTYYSASFHTSPSISQRMLILDSEHSNSLKIDFYLLFLTRSFPVVPWEYIGWVILVFHQNKVNPSCKSNPSDARAIWLRVDGTSSKGCGFWSCIQRVSFSTLSAALTLWAFFSCLLRLFPSLPVLWKVTLMEEASHCVSFQVAAAVTQGAKSYAILTVMLISRSSYNQPPIPFADITKIYCLKSIQRLLGLGYLWKKKLVPRVMSAMPVSEEGAVRQHKSMKWRCLWWKFSFFFYPWF